MSSRPPATTPSVIYSPSSKLVDYGSLSIADIRTTDFIRFTNFQLNSDAQIMQFYRDVFTQGWQYRVYVAAIDAVNSTHSVAPSNLSSEAKTLIGTTLHTKFRQFGCINKNYTTGIALLNSTRDGYEFLE